MLRADGTNSGYLSSADRQASHLGEPGRVVGARQIPLDRPSPRQFRPSAVSLAGRRRVHPLFGLENPTVRQSSGSAWTAGGTTSTLTCSGMSTSSGMYRSCNITTGRRPPPFNVNNYTYSVGIGGSQPATEYGSYGRFMVNGAHARAVRRGDGRKCVIKVHLRSISGVGPGVVSILRYPTTRRRLPGHESAIQYTATAHS